MLKPSHRASARIYIFEETSCHSTKKEINNQNPKPQTHHPIIMKTSLLMNSLPMRLMDNRYFFPLLTRNPCDLSYRYVNCVPMSRWPWHAALEVPFHFQACLIYIRCLFHSKPSTRSWFPVLTQQLHIQYITVHRSKYKPISSTSAEKSEQTHRSVHREQILEANNF